MELRLFLKNSLKFQTVIKDLIPRKQVRGFEMNLKKYSEGTINFQDLRRAYKFDHPQINYRTKTKRDIMSVRLRWKILYRDNFKCVVCGADGRSSVLHVDHIKPVSLGGKTEEINLRTLCAECNMGKFNYVL
jgi:hypothetical protein